MTAKELYQYAKNQRLNKLAWLQNILAQEAILGRYCTEFADYEIDTDCLVWLGKNQFSWECVANKTGGRDSRDIFTYIISWYRPEVL